MAYNLSIVTDILEATNFLEESAQCRVLKAALAYLYDKEYELDNTEEIVAFKVLTPMLSHAKKRSQERSEKMRENGKKGGRKKINHDSTKANESKKTNLVILQTQEDPLSSPSSFSPTPPLSTPPIIPQENSSSSCVCTHAREEDFGLQVGVIATIEKYAERYRSEGLWTDVAMRNHIKIEQAQEIFRDFVMDQKHNSTDYTNYSDFKRHFLNYIRIRAAAIKAEESQQTKQPKVITGSDLLKIYG